MGDRRFNVAKYQENKLQITQQEIDAIEHELGAFAHHLSVYNASFDKARTGEIFKETPIEPDVATDSPLEAALEWLRG